MSTPADDALQPLVAAELAALATLLEGLPAADWDRPSLCDGWRVREVVAHLTMAARYTAAQFEQELRADGFDFGALSDRVAARDGALPTSVLVADLQSDALARWAAPGGGYAGSLNHAVVHGLDVTVALGLDRRPPDETTRAALDGLTTEGAPTRTGVDLVGVELRATDLDWSWGSGRTIAAPAARLVLALARRPVAGVALGATA